MNVQIKELESAAVILQGVGPLTKRVVLRGSDPRSVRGYQK